MDAFTNIVRDPRLALQASDTQVVNSIEAQGFGGVPDHRLNIGSSCFGCHSDGMNRGSDDLREGLDNSPDSLPKGEHGVDSWINDENVIAQVRTLYATNEVVHAQMEADRRPFLSAMAQIKTGMIAGPDKNLYGRAHHLDRGVGAEALQLPAGSLELSPTRAERRGLAEGLIDGFRFVSTFVVSAFSICTFVCPGEKFLTPLILSGLSWRRSPLLRPNQIATPSPEPAESARS